MEIIEYFKFKKGERQKVAAIIDTENITENSAILEISKTIECSYMDAKKVYNRFKK